MPRQASPHGPWTCPQSRCSEEMTRSPNPASQGLGQVTDTCTRCRPFHGIFAWLANHCNSTGFPSASRPTSAMSIVRASAQFDISRSVSMEICEQGSNHHKWTSCAGPSSTEDNLCGHPAHDTSTSKKVTPRSFDRRRRRHACKSTLGAGPADCPSGHSLRRPTRLQSTPYAMVIDARAAIHFCALHAADR